MVLTLRGLYVYPVKSLAGIALQESVVLPRGLQYDRRWMLVDETGLFVSQREIPEMALLGTAMEQSFLVVFSRKNPAIRLRILLEAPVETMEPVIVRVWDDTCAALACEKSVNDWFSSFLGYPLRLVFMPDSTRRLADERYADNTAVSFADGFPFLLIGQASLDDLNSRLEKPLPMNRFRPNFVFSGGAPYAEDGWRDFRIGDQPFRGVKPCGRCAIITTDQDTAERGTEPLHTLATYRRVGQKVLFGQNAIWLGAGDRAIVKVGDTVSPQLQEGVCE